jgi:hypothetical protein
VRYIPLLLIITGDHTHIITANTHITDIMITDIMAIDITQIMDIMAIGTTQITATGITGIRRSQ